MKQIDFIGEPERAPFKDLPNMRASVQDKKACLLLELGRLINRPPVPSSIDTVQKVRLYKDVRNSAAKIAGGLRSSIPQIESAINSMQPYHRT